MSSCSPCARALPPATATAPSAAPVAPAAPALPGAAPAASADAAAPARAETGRITLALFLAGFTTFSLLYCVQPLLPLLARAYGVGAAQSALALSVSTACLALSILVAGALSESLGRRGLMLASMTAAALLNAVAALMPGWQGLLLARAAVGVLLGGVPAVAMAYLAEEIPPAQLGRVMGQYVAGTAFGGMAGRVGVGLLTDALGWREALLACSALGLLAALGFGWLLPASRHFQRKPYAGLGPHLRTWGAQLRHPALPWLFGMGFLLMGMFVAVYNVAGFRLAAAPFSLSQSAIGLIFCTYVAGMLASNLSGRASERWGRAPTLLTAIALAALGLLLSLAQDLTLMIAGLVLLTMGFFIGHSVSSAWVGRLGGAHKGHAAALYLLAYYLGSSLLGAAGGWAWDHGGWAAVAGFTLGLMALAAGLTRSLARRAD